MGLFVSSNILKIIFSALVLTAIVVAPQVRLPNEITINNPITQPVTAHEIEIPPFETEATALGAYETTENEAVITYEGDKVWPIASLTKMMTAIVFFEQNPNLKQSITIEKEDMVGGGMIKVPVGTKMSAEDLIHATLMVSANNAAHALYKATPLSKEEFVAKMNERAQSMGLTKTVFTDPTGLDPTNISTSEEYVHVMKAAMEIPQVRKIMTKTYYEMLPKGKRSFAIGNTNKFLRQETDFTVTGAKTGLLNESGFNLAVQAEKDGEEMVAVVFGEASFEKAFSDARKLLEKAFEKHEKTK
jgi:D-alanyl-D-alanine endopeptidase (penicillin-binding protein 7)